MISSSPLESGIWSLEILNVPPGSPRVLVNGEIYG